MQKIALITGATGGVGQALAATLAADGWILVLAGRDLARLKHVYGEAHLQIEADCTTVAGVRRIFKVAREHELVPTALAHCVGNIRLGAMHRMAEADFMDCINANLISAFHTLAGFIGNLREAGSPGAAVLVSSAAARIGTPNHEAIAAAKAGVEGLVRGAASTHAPAGIRINAVAPGIMDTPASAAMLANAAVREAAARQYPLPGIGSSAELANLMAWLLSEHASRVTGQVWSMDGGFSTIRPLVK
ncbi:SDR family oxidoreductase [Herbaspirillum sp. RTI4]|uniref:SDR family NAD(P)-dependent oxidoreductase n=1 Tax=Herbaspirillum sp. RTI4 TaxID=3048640 RepID=UPI002AB3BC98|nr:SDR family oxidoreductase [Herbaspirillum sp. RTI4]MDY7578797.1 SDR family oxidoreductase [Herbaspirillum sp. RTI4]MEA9982282.1 SDR family oxidoreductase [Herbaspirillum sp. RTI4]